MCQPMTMVSTLEGIVSSDGDVVVAMWAVNTPGLKCVPISSTQVRVSDVGQMTIARRACQSLVRRAAKALMV